MPLSPLPLTRVLRPGSWRPAGLNAACKRHYASQHCHHARTSASDCADVTPPLRRRSSFVDRTTPSHHTPRPPPELFLEKRKRGRPARSLHRRCCCNAAACAAALRSAAGLLCRCAYRRRCGCALSRVTSRARHAAAVCPWTASSCTTSSLQQLDLLGAPCRLSACPNAVCSRLRAVACQGCRGSRAARTCRTMPSSRPRAASTRRCSAGAPAGLGNASPFCADRCAPKAERAGSRPGVAARDGRALHHVLAEPGCVRHQALLAPRSAHAGVLQAPTRRRRCPCRGWSGALALRRNLAVLRRA